MKNNMRTVLSLSAAALCGAAFVLLLYSGVWGAPVSMQHGGSDAADSAGQGTDALPHATRLASPGSSLRIPVVVDFSTPFASQYERIAKRADRGDLNAICTLVQALEYCTSRERMRSEAQDILDLAASQASGGEQEAGLMRDLLAKDEAAAAADRFCGHLDAANPEELARRTYQAAERGDLGAMLRFALRPPLGGEVGVENAELVLSYRTESPKMLERAAFMGSRDAARAILIAQLRGSLASDYGEVPLERDPDLLFAAAAVVRRFDGPELDVESELAQALDKVQASPPSPRAARLRASMEQAVVKRMQVDTSSVDQPVDLERASCR